MLGSVWATLLLSICLCTHEAAASPQNGEIADQIRAVVGRKIISESDIELHRYIAKIQPSIFTPFELHRQDDPLNFLIDIEIMNQLAQNISIYQPDPDRFQQRYQELTSLLTILSHILDEPKLRHHLLMLMTAEKFAKRNMGIKEEYGDWIKLLRERVPYRIVQP
ncbi:MAG: hypothetical protein VX278_14640 [Myxococcota bacterium]|nr:hypothetical protein [Myxococcota bacterium]